MKAIGYQQCLSADNENALTDITLDQPQAAGRDLLVEVKAISVNPVDTKIRTNVAPAAGDWKVIGWDAAGIVTAVGDGVTDFKVGDEVFYAGDLTRSGSNAEFQLVDERIVGRKPASLSFAEAAAMPLTAITAYELLFDRLQVATTEPKKLLVVGAAGGVGSILVQLAKKLTNLEVIGTASRTESSDWLKQLGVDHVINHRNPLSEELKAIGIDEVDYVAGLTNSDDHLQEIVKSLKPQGQFGLIDDPQVFDIRALKQKSISLHWEFMYTRSMFTTDDMIAQQQLLNKVADLVDAGDLKTTVGEHFGTINAANLLKAHRLLESQKAIGKIVLEGF
ncbi:zinc-binding alcohol dehydrogenase family protein [Ferrimonas lipolytica]|uniref:Zinc-type alcohol dehydrogenase-like protein n=1 Tax=Ferrimonas lipolytica TaxID=2724191 RepID=A0A6H1UEU6_9GAMM|nr:zinc-binding alcohol dehydrogenase family protein [Ferrimonas lipolytica]QIZ77627.1 zinc-binding alcohol dehydrogenase family protein [Ferrimonas lipolytica]